jgi:radical SAM protein with 4Fe4S-binding SPASM domain
LAILKEEESVVKAHFQCQEVFDKLSINWDGTVSACCTDYDDKMLIGNIEDQSASTIWNNDKMNHYRSMLLEMRHEELDLCKTCYGYHGLQTAAEVSDH